jgi:predicted alpha/beta-fold hydrolase
MSGAVRAIDTPRKIMTVPFAPDFRPLPLLGNPHVQTVLGAYLPGGGCPLPEKQIAVALPDGDQVLVHQNTPTPWKPGHPVALLLHGLTGNHASTHIRRMAARLLESDVRVYRMDMRGAGAGLPLARLTYHSGRSEDVRFALAEIARLNPGSPQLLVGMSLGGNVALKLAGELPEHPVPNLARVAAIAPPIDLMRCSRLLMLPRNRVYERRFTNALVRDVRRRQVYFPDPPLPDAPAAHPRPDADRDSARRSVHRRGAVRGTFSSRAHQPAHLAAGRARGVRWLGRGRRRPLGRTQDCRVGGRCLDQE